MQQYAGRNERQHPPTPTPSNHAAHTHVPIASAALAMPVEYGTTQVYHDHHVMHPPNPPPAVRHQHASVYPQPDRQQHPTVIRFHDRQPQQQGSLRISPRDNLRSPSYTHPTAQTHVIHGAPHYSVQYAPANQHVFQPPPYGMPRVQPNPQPPPHPQAQLSTTYVAYYSVPPSTQHPQPVPANPVAPSQVQPLPQQEAVVYETAARGPQAQSTIYLPAQGRSYYPQDTPDPTGAQGTVIQGSYYHPGAATSLLVARQEINPRASTELPAFGNHSHPQPVISSTTLSNPSRLTQERNMMRGSAVYPVRNRTQDIGVQEVPRAQVVAKLGQPPAYPLITGQNKIASPLAFTSLQHQGYQRHGPGPGPGPGPSSEVPIRPVPHLHSTPPIIPQAVPHDTAPIIAPALPPHAVVPAPQQPSTFLDYVHGPYQGQREMYDNALRLHHLYGAPPTLHYVPQPAPKKKRLQWTPELHAKFEAALDDIGIETAVPKTLLQAMNEPCLTRENVASHLQKYREMIRKKRAVENRQSGSQPPSRKRSNSDLDESCEDHNEADGRKNARVSSGSGSRADAEKNSHSSRGQSTSKANDTSGKLSSDANHSGEDSGSFAETDETQGRSPSRSLRQEIHRKLRIPTHEPSNSPEVRRREAAQLVHRNDIGVSRKSTDLQCTVSGRGSGTVESKAAPDLVPSSNEQVVDHPSLETEKNTKRFDSAIAKGRGEIRAEKRL